MAGTRVAGTKTAGRRPGKLAQVSERDSFSDEVPVADAVEQERPAAESADVESVDPSGDGAPLESNESDWQEQRQIVENPEQDEIR